jgi:hypothetical protein
MPTSRAARPGPHRTGQEWLWALLLAVLSLVVGGCAQPGTETTQGAASATSTPPATVTVGPDDGGRTVDLEVADRLIVQLSSMTSPSRLRPAWTLRSPPPKVLRRVQGDPAATQVVFIADQPGTVQLVLVKRYGCDPPLRCPVAEPSGQSERMRPPLERPTVAITVRVR